MTGADAPLPLPDLVDVAIVGAGPTGLALACALAAQGVAIAVLDQAAEGGATSRAAVVHARTLEILETINLSQDLVSRGIVVPRFAIRDRGRTLLTVRFDGLPTDYPYTLMLPQDVTERLLVDRLLATGGVVYRGHTVTDVSAGDASVTVAVTRPGGASTRLRARYLVSCDGMHSVVRQRMRIGFSGEPYPQSFALADVSMEWALPRDEVNLFFSPHGLVVVAPLPGDRYRIVATMDDAPERLAQADLQALLDDRGPVKPPARIRDVVWSSRFRVHHRIADTYRRGRMFLAGDAAHVHSPAGGQGMNIGIQDATTLAPLLADAVFHPENAGRLGDYEAARRPVALGVVAMTDRLTRAATAGNAATRALRNSALSLAGHLPPIHRKLAMSLSELDAR